MTDILIDRLLEAYAKSLAVYYAAEKTFMADPTRETLHTYSIALDRHVALRDELRRGNRIGDALVGTEQDESVER